MVPNVLQLHQQMNTTTLNVNLTFPRKLSHDLIAHGIMGDKTIDRQWLCWHMVPNDSRLYQHMVPNDS